MSNQVSMERRIQGHVKLGLGCETGAEHTLRKGFLLEMSLVPRD